MNVSYKKKLERLKEQMAGLSGDLLVDIAQQVDGLANLMDDLPDEISLHFAGDPKSDGAAEHKQKLKSLKKKWKRIRKDVDALILGSGSQNLIPGSDSKDKKTATTGGARKNIGKEEKQKSLKVFIENTGEWFTRGDVEKHLSTEFDRSISLAFYKPMLDYLVNQGVVASRQVDKNNPKSAITYGLRRNKTVDFTGME